MNRDRPLETGEVTLHVVDRGPVDGDPVVLLHGWPDSTHLWRHQIPALAAAGFRVVAPDQRGFGRSDAPTDRSSYRIRSIIGDFQAVLTDTGFDAVHLVGHDWGAAIAWSIARHVPEALRTLTVMSTGHPQAYRGSDLEQRRRSWYMLMFLHEEVAEEWLSADDWSGFRQFTGHHSETERWVADLSRPGRLTASLEWYRANMPAAALVAPPVSEAPVPVDTMGIWSSGDFVLLEDQMRSSGQHVSGRWRYERVDAGHWIPIDAPDEVNRLLLDWLPG